MRRGKPSSTAIWVSFWRGLGAFDDPCIAKDDGAAAVVWRPLGALLRSAERHPVAARIALRAIARASFDASRHLAFRTRAIDDAIERDLGSHHRPTDVILLGAGLDARPDRLASLRDAAVYEVDHAATQDYKRAKLEKRHGERGIGSRVDVRYAPCDFGRGSLVDSLARAGYRAPRRSIVVWEGVTMYLPEESIRGTLRGLGSLLAPGSLLLVTYLARRPPLPLAGAVGVMGEPFHSCFSPSALRALLAEHGFDAERDEGSREWGERYLGRPVPSAFERLCLARRAG